MKRHKTFIALVVVSIFAVVEVHSENIPTEQPKTLEKPFSVFKDGKPEDYVDIQEVIKKLDCKGEYTTAQRALLLSDFTNKRVKFSSEVIDVYVENNRFFLGYAFDKGMVDAIPTNKALFRHITASKKKYNFDCKITHHCESGFIDSGLKFTDCYINY